MANTGTLRNCKIQSVRNDTRCFSLTIGGCLGLGEPTNKTRKICKPVKIHVRNSDDVGDDPYADLGEDDHDDDDDVETAESSLVFSEVFCCRDSTALLTQDGELFVAGENRALAP